MIIGTVRPEEAKVFNSKEGYHQARNADGEPIGCTFEVFWDDPAINKYDGEPRNFDEDGDPVRPGWYWWACLPGCLPDGEASGPFASSQQAFDDAMGDDYE